MLQRLAGIKQTIDSRIAEEQARQRALSGSPSRSNSITARSAARDASPAVRSGARRAPARNNEEEAVKSPDPKVFEADFVIADEDAPSRAGTPQPSSSRKAATSEGGASTTALQESNGDSTAAQGEGDGQDPRPPSGPPSEPPSGLPSEVRVKLRKLERLESRYQELLRSYRIAHARVSLIEPFEAALREHTPLTTISDPGALIEYLNQVEMKSNMSHDELKRVSQERDTLKGKLAVAEVKVYEAEDALKKRNAVEFAPKAENEGEQEENDVSNAKEGVAAQARSSLDSQKTESATKSPLLSGMSRSTLSIFSPKKQPLPDPPANEEPEEFFSFDKEVPRLESELEERQKEVSTLQSELATLKHDLSSAQESTHSMAQNLEQTTREVNSLREQKEVLESELFKEKADSGSKVSDLRSQLEAADAKLRQIADEAQPENLEKTKANQKLLSEAQAELDRLRASSEEYTKALDKSRDLQGKVDALEKELSGLKEHKIKPEESDRKLKSLKAIADKLTVDLNCARREKREMESELRVSSESIAELKRKLQDIPESTRCKTDHGLTEEAKAKDEQAAATAPEQESGPGKKKNKKKKKAAKAQEENATNEPNNAGASSKTASLNEQATQLQNRNQELEALLATKEETIVKLQAKLKDQDDLKEEIESLRDDLVNLGGDHVDAKDKVKQLQTEKSVLESSLADAVKDAADLQAAQALAKGESTEAHKELKTQFEDLKVTAAGLQTDLAVAQQLASARFKDLTDLRTVLQKAQPEMASLKEENTSLKALRDELNGKVSDLLRVEAKHTVLRGELQELRKRIGERDTEMKTLNQRLTQERASRDKSDDSYSKATQRLQSLESEKKQLTTTLEQHVNDVRKSNDELAALKAQLRNLEASMSRLEKHNTGLKEDLELKTAQHVSAESLITSMRDQAAEMAVQKREAQEKCDSLEEEVADAHRLLGERGREAETMRRLLSETEGRADARMRDMKERMDTAVEERDKAEDEASTIGRRRARELEDARNKFREAERSLKRVEEEKEELELVEKDWKRRREELEKRAEASTREAGEVRKAMGSLRDALDESEKQARTLEREKSELRRAVEETQQRLERLQKSNKALADEARAIQAKSKPVDSRIATPRSSMDSGPSRSNALSPAPRPSAASAAVNGSAPDHATFTEHLKNVLLKFLEQKDKKNQMQLVPVLAMMLHFDLNDEQRWIAAITTR